MKLLKEAIQSAVFDMQNPEKRLYIEGIFMQGEIVNANGRLYPIAVLEKACDTYRTDFIETNRSVGELNHPDSPIIDMERACIKTVSLERRGNDIYGKAMVLSFAKGPIIEGMYRDGIQIAVSSRGLASVNKFDGVEHVQDDFQICAAADVVYDPSAPKAFVNPILENKEWYIENGVILPKTMDIAEKAVKSARGKTQINEAMSVAAKLFAEAIRS